MSDISAPTILTFAPARTSERKGVNRVMKCADGGKQRKERKDGSKKEE